MSEQSQEDEGLENQSGDPGRTPGSAEGDRETVEQDLQEQDNEDSENYEKTREKKLEESDTGNNQ